MAVLQINQLTKRFGGITAVDNLSLSVEAGTVLGLLGPNGSGKTTTLGLILGILKPDQGSYSWFDGKYGKDERLHIGSLLETPNFYPYMSTWKNLEIVAHIKRVKQPRIGELLELVNLSERKDHAFSTFSFGMKQRLAIAASLIGDPPVLIFDEPANGLDPQGIAEVRDLVKQIASDGKTIIMASHILDEVEKVCSHVAIIKKGKLLATGEIGSIISKERQIEIGCDDLDQLKSLLLTMPGINKIERKHFFLLLQVSQSLSASELSKVAIDKGITLTHLLVRAKSLESEFLEITSSGNKKNYV